MTATRILNFAFGIAIGTQIIGCTSVLKGDPELDARVKRFEPKADLAQIYVCRNSRSFWGGAVQPTIYVDDQPIGDVGVSSYAYAEVPPGEHRLVAKTLEHESKMDVMTFKAGEQKFFSTFVTAGFLVSWGVIDEMTEADGRDCVKKGVLVKKSVSKTGGAAERQASAYGASAANTNNAEKIEEKPAAAQAPVVPSKVAEASPAKVSTTNAASGVVSPSRSAATAASSQNAANSVPATTISGSGYAAIDDVAAVPYLTEQGRNAYREYLDKPAPKAFAVAGNGGAYSVWGKSRDLSLPASAGERALVLCERVAKRPCVLYAVDSTVVWVKQ